MRKVIKVLVGIFWQLPLAILSYCWFRSIRWVMCQVVAKKKNKERSVKGDSFVWVELSEALRNIPLIRPYTMVTGPRWNCHALMLVVGLFKVRSCIEIDVATARKSAKQWTIVIYAKDYQTESFVSYLDVPRDTDWYRVELTTNNCLICIRYYNVEETIVCPAIKIDGELLINKRPLPANQMQMYESYLTSVKNYRNFLYLWMHYYLYPLLEWRKYFPDDFVKRQYLPMGNPDTEFLFGSIKKQEYVHFTFEQKLFNAANLYITLLNNGSFPVFWDSIKQVDYRSPKMPCNGTYLIRIHFKTKKLGELGAVSVRTPRG